VISPETAETVTAPAGDVAYPGPEKPVEPEETGISSPEFIATLVSHQVSIMNLVGVVTK
jgi:hypothetical protein